MQISYDRQLSEISAYRNRILLFQVSMMLRKTQPDLYIITDEFSSNSPCIHRLTPSIFPRRNRLAASRFDPSPLNVISRYPSRFDPPPFYHLRLHEKLNFQISPYRTSLFLLHRRIKRFDRLFSILESVIQNLYWIGN